MPPRRDTAGPAAGAAGARQLLRTSGLPATEARALLCALLELPRERLVAHPDTAVAPGAAQRFHALAEQRRRGVPLAYLLGTQEFYGHALHVNPDVLIPRPDTELLVDTALDVLAQRPQARVLDLGTGSGAIAIALALARPGLDIVATDVSTAALRVAQHNARRLGARIQLVAADWFAPVAGRFDLIISNPPYIAAADPHLDALGDEPRRALTDDADGLGALRSVIGGAAARLAVDGTLLVEHGYDQGAAVRALLQAAGFGARTLRDLAGQERACLGTRAAG